MVLEVRDDDSACLVEDDRAIAVDEDSGWRVEVV